HLVGAGGRVDAGDPQPAEVALLVAATHVGEVARAVDRLLRLAVKLALVEEEALGQGEKLLPLLPALGSTLDSRHRRLSSTRPCGLTGPSRFQAATWPGWCDDHPWMRARSARPGKN